MEGRDSLDDGFHFMTEDYQHPGYFLRFLIVVFSLALVICCIVRVFEQPATPSARSVLYSDRVELITEGRVTAIYLVYPEARFLNRWSWHPAITYTQIDLEGQNGRPVQLKICGEHLSDVVRLGEAYIVTVDGGDFDVYSHCFTKTKSVQTFFGNDE